MEDLLLLSKMQMQQFSPHFKTVEIASLFNEMRILYPDTATLQITFTDAEQLTLLTDENYLKTILRNLNTNAIKAVKE